MIPTHKRFEDQDGFLAKLHWIVCQPFSQGLFGALVIAFIVWISGALSAMPVNFVQKGEFKSLTDKHDIDYKYLEEHKMDKSDYYREHIALEDRMNARFDKMDRADEKILTAILAINNRQVKQYKKVNGE